MGITLHIRRTLSNDMKCTSGMNTFRIVAIIFFLFLPYEILNFLLSSKYFSAIPFSNFFLVLMSETIEIRRNHLFLPCFYDPPCPNIYPSCTQLRLFDFAFFTSFFQISFFLLLVNPCKTTNGGCHHKCASNGRGVTCACNVGFALAGKSKQCKPGRDWDVERCFRFGLSPNFVDSICLNG